MEWCTQEAIHQDGKFHRLRDDIIYVDSVGLSRKHLDTSATVGYGSELHLQACGPNQTYSAVAKLLLLHVSSIIGKHYVQQSFSYFLPFLVWPVGPSYVEVLRVERFIEPSYD